MKKRITSVDVAKEAGVSRATVSYILNNTEGARISDLTRDKVLKAAQKLGYHLDINAQALKTNRSMSIGVVSRRDVTESRFVNVLGGIKEVLGKEKYSILLCSDEKDSRGYPEYLSLYHSKKIDGIIFISYQEQLEIEHAEERASLMIKEQIPCVFADYHLQDPMVNGVDINYYHGAYIATRYLIDKGHKSIAFLMPEINTEQERQRLDGVKKAVSEAEAVELILYSAGEKEEIFSNNIVNMLEDRNKYTSIITAWGKMAAITLYHTNRMKISVPQEVAIISLAGDNAAKYTYPRLSTSELPLYELGLKCAQSLIDGINKPEMPVNLKLPCKLQIRDSC